MLRLVLGCSVVGVAWWFVRPLLSGVAFAEVARTATSVDATHLGLLVCIWAVSACLHAVIVSLALPGLGARRNVMLSLAGSALINTVPMGGTVATVVNWRMVRRWG